MADHPDFTDDEKVRAKAVFLETGSYTKAAQAVGRSLGGTRDMLRREGSDVERRRLHARRMDAALAEFVDLQRVAVRKLRGDLSDPKKRTDAVFAINDALGKLSTARTAYAKMTGEHAAEKHQHHIDVTKLPDDALDAELHAFATRGADAGGEGAAGAAPAGEGATGSGASDDTDDEGEATEP